MKRLVAFSLLLVMLCSSFIVGTAAPAAEPKTTDPLQLGEVLALREKNSETYRLEDGSYECVVFAEDKYFEDETGKLVEINNTVVPEKHTIAGKEYGFTNEANSTRIYFSENEPSVLVSTGKQDLAFSIVTDSAVTPVIGGLKDIGEIAEYSLSGDTCFAYMNAFEHTDLVYKVRNGMLKEYLVLNDADAPREFTFTFDTEGYTVSCTEHGTVGFYGGEGDLVFELGDLFAVDSSEAYTNELSYSIGEEVEGKTDITVTISENYANDPERAYPILVDPSVMVTGTYDTYDSFVSSKNPTENYYHDEHIRMGWNSGYNKRRTYISFELPSSVPSNAITTAYMSLKKYGAGSTPSLKAYRVTGSWTSSTITWNNKPSYSTLYASDTAEPKTNNWYRFYVTDIVRKWYDGTYQNYGFLVKDSDESSSSSWSTFYSSDANYPNRPELRIRYLEITCWYSDKAVIGKWMSSPSVFYSNLSPNVSFPFAVGIEHGIEEWNAALGLSITTESNSNASIVYYGGTKTAIDALVLFDPVEDGALGLTRPIDYEYIGYYNYNGNKYLYIIKEVDGYIVRVSYPQSTNLTYIKTCTHELGHALGWFWHPNFNQPQQVMHQGLFELIELSDKEIAHLVQVYQ